MIGGSTRDCLAGLGVMRISCQHGRYSLPGRKGRVLWIAHWLGQRGIVMVRNPSNESRQFSLDLTKVGAPGDLADAICYTQYPYRRGIATGLTGRSQLSLTLSPWEVVFLEIVAHRELREAIAVGGRWYRELGGAMSIAPDHGQSMVRLIEPGGSERPLNVPTPYGSTLLPAS